MSFTDFSIEDDNVEDKKSPLDAKMIFNIISVLSLIGTVVSYYLMQNMNITIILATIFILTFIVSNLVVNKIAIAISIIIGVILLINPSQESLGEISYPALCVSVLIFIGGLIASYVANSRFSKING